MRYRATFFTGLAVGFVLGARAGRERYEQMKALARRATENPSVQQAAGTAAAQATDLAKTARAKVTDKVQQRKPGFADTAIRKASERLPGWRDKQAGADAEAGDGVPPVPAPGGPADTYPPPGGPADTYPPPGTPGPVPQSAGRSRNRGLRHRAGTVTAAAPADRSFERMRRRPGCPGRRPTASGVRCCASR